MAVSGTYVPVREAGDGSKVDFSFTFKVQAASDLVVSKVLKSTDAETILTLGVDYTVVLSTTTDGGVVTFMVAPTALQDSLIYMDVPLTQTAEIPTNGIFREVQIENALDKLALICQQLQEQIDRCVRQPISDSAPAIDLDELAADVAAASSAKTDAETAQAAAEAAQAAAEAAAATATGASTVRLTGDQTVAGIKTFSSSPVIPTPTTDMQAATKKYVDDATGTGFGSTTSKNFDTAYLAATDGEVTAYGQETGQVTWISGLTDSAADPTTAIIHSQSPVGYYAGLTFSVKKGDSYKVMKLLGGGTASAMYWRPKGS